MKHSFFILIFFLICTSARSQTAADVEYHLSIEEPGIAIELLQRTGKNELGADYYRFYAAALLMRNEFSEAQQKLTRGQEQYPENLYLKQVQAEIYLQAGDLERALTMYEELETVARGADTDMYNQIRDRLGSIYELAGTRAANRRQFHEATRYFRQVTNYMPGYIGGWYNRALAYYNLQQFDDALDSIERALMVDKNHEQSRELRLALLAQLQRKDRVITLLDEEIEQNPDDLSLRISRLRTLITDGRPEDAQSYAEDLMVEFSAERELYDELAAINRRMGHADGELNIIRKKRVSFPDDPEILIELSSLHERMKEWDMAAAKLDSLAAHEGYHEIAYANKGRMMEARGKPEEAVEVYKKGLMKEPNSEILNRRLGWILMDLELWGSADETWQRLYSQTGETNDLLLWAEAKEKASGLKEAIVVYKNVLQKIDGPAQALFASARISAIRHNDEIACTRAGEALIAGYRELKNQRQHLTGELQQRPLPSQSSQDIDRSPQQIEKKRALVYDAFSFIHQHCNEYVTEKVLQNLQNKFGDDGEVIFFSAKWGYLKGNYSSALSKVNLSVTRMPELPEAHNLQARIFEKKENWQQARQAWHRYHSLKPESDQAYQRLITSYRQTGELDSLVYRWQSYYLTNPDNEQLKKYLREILFRLGRNDEAAGL